MVLSGQLEVLKKTSHAEQAVSRLGAGQYFGEMALLGRHPRTATARAVTHLA